MERELAKYKAQIEEIKKNYASLEAITGLVPLKTKDPREQRRPFDNPPTPLCWLVPTT